MLQIKNISKTYTTGSLVQTALDDVSLNLRDNEFVAILGPSGSGKTTLLNVIGGLDRYDSGEMIINGISTVRYRDRDWDSYRNHTIGFVFQSYNLIPHQSVLSNVELALTISGIKRSKRREMAKKALERVGLGDQLHKKPNQMSGGQMQRVAIARALVNNPDILLADEPTGALDTETSIQVMELLKEVAKDRLVVMVTHNPELAEQYATRTVRLRDGKITDDTAPYTVDESITEKSKHKNMGRSSMSFFTALSLSFNNLRTKKGRTFLTSFAGSIGIIGIALILSLSNGVNTYITDIQKSTMASYPISITAKTVDLSSLMEAGRESTQKTEADHPLDAVYSDGKGIELASTMTTSITENNLTDFKKYLDDPESEINRYIGENGIVYSYNPDFGVYTHDPDGVFVNTDGSTLEESGSQGSVTRMSSMSQSSSASPMSSMNSAMSNKNPLFSELMPTKNGNNISDAVTSSYDILSGSWPKAYNEAVLVLDKNNEITLTQMYELGLLPSEEYRQIVKDIKAGTDITVKDYSISFDDILSMELYLVPACDTYKLGSNGLYEDISDDTAEMEELLKNAVRLKISGVVRENEQSDTGLITSVIGYTRALTDYLTEYADVSGIVKAQKASPDVNVINGMAFSPDDDKAKIADAKTYLKNLGVSDKAAMCKTMLQNVYAGNEQMTAQLMAMDEAGLAAMLDQYLADPSDDVMLSIYKTYISSGSYDENMAAFGVVSLDAPTEISIYADSFEDKDAISGCIESYNNSANEENKITYTDFVGLLMSSVTDIVNIVSYVLIAFVAVSLVVSSIMIGIITYISVLERTKEIGILRAMGASKHNISQVFNAETFMVGIFAGLIGVGLSLAMLVPINAIIHSLADSAEVNAALPAAGAVILVVLSILLTLIGGLIPSKKASRKDPVTALRTE